MRRVTFLTDDALAGIKQGLDELCTQCGEQPRLIAWSAEEVQ